MTEYQVQMMSVVGEILYYQAAGDNGYLKLWKVKLWIRAVLSNLHKTSMTYSSAKPAQRFVVPVDTLGPPRHIWLISFSKAFIKIYYFLSSPEDIFPSLILERGEGREGRETSMWERSIDRLPMICAWTGDHTCLHQGSNPQLGMCSD